MFLLAGIEMVLDTNEDFIVTELEKQKRKLREISLTLEQQHHLLRLIIQVINIFNKLKIVLVIQTSLLENGNKN